MNRKHFIKIAGLSIGSILIPYALLKAQQNPYLIEFNRLPHSYHRNGEPLIRFAEKDREESYRKKRMELVTKYSWAVPTEEAINSIADYSKTGLIDFGAGSGYWASLISNKGINVNAIDNWTDKKPEHLFYPVKTGSYELLKFQSDKVLMLVWVPQATDMALTALKTWNGKKLIYVGEPPPARGNANPAFFEELKNWTLVKVITIPQWYNWNDAVYFYKKE